MIWYVAIDTRFHPIIHQQIDACTIACVTQAFCAFRDAGTEHGSLHSSGHPCRLTAKGIHLLNLLKQYCKSSGITKPYACNYCSEINGAVPSKAPQLEQIYCLSDIRLCLS